MDHSRECLYFGMLEKMLTCKVLALYAFSVRYTHITRVLYAQIVEWISFILQLNFYIFMQQ